MGSFGSPKNCLTVKWFLSLGGRGVLVCITLLGQRKASHSSYTVCLQNIFHEHPTHACGEVTSNVGHFPTDTLQRRAQKAQPG